MQILQANVWKVLVIDIVEWNDFKAIKLIDEIFGV